MPQSKAPLIFLAVRTTIMIRAKKNIKQLALVNSPRDREICPNLITPALIKPISAINKPIPTETAFFRLIGIDLKIASLTPLVTTT